MSTDQLSFWGWGYADRFPDDDARRDLAARLENSLGFPERPLLDPPSLEDCACPSPALGPPSELDCVTADREARIRHTYGGAYRDMVRGFHGDFGSAPDLVATPEDADGVERVLGWAAENRVAVMPYGGGTSVVGGVEADVEESFAGTLSLDLRELDAVHEVDPVSRSARIGAGATGPEISDQLADHGLQLRHYPQSYEFSTLGGWIATRAGGHFATLYTHIDDFVESVDLVAPEGRIETRRLPASGAGPDPNRLVLGSEGTLGAVTEAWMQVQPRPEYRARASVHFDDWDDAVAATRDIVQARLYPANCRLLDSKEAMLHEVAFGPHVLVLGFESTDHPVDGDLDRALEICADHGATVADEPTYEHPGEETERGGDEGDWRSAFVDGPYLFNSLVSLGVVVDTFETAVTWDQFDDLHAALQERVGAKMDEVCGTGYLSCRFTHVYPDGPAPYYTFMAPGDVGSELDQWREIKREASDVLMEYGATITHHHAVGRVHREWYHREAPGRYIDALRAVKRELDPEGVMNPGALL